MLLVDRLLGRFGLFMLAFIITIPLLWPLLAEYEGRAFPVVSRAQVAKFVVHDDGSAPAVDVWVVFEKKRQCDFVGLHWYNSQNHRLPIVFPDSSNSTPPTRPVGGQGDGPWKIVGLSSLEGSRAVVTHRCHFLWLTNSVFYP